MDGGSVYILTNDDHSIFYVGVCSNLRQRILEHMDKVYENSFTAKHNCTRLVYYEIFDSLQEAMTREKELTAKTDAKKIKLVEKNNPMWDDLSENLEEPEE